MIRIRIQMDFAGGYGRGVLRGVMGYANLRTNWEFVMPPMYALDAAGEPDAEGRADGAVVMVHSLGAADGFRRDRVPTVNVAHTLPLDALAAAGIPTVVPDDAAIGRLGFAHFWDRQFRSFGYCGHPTAAWSIVREAAFADACRERGVPFTEVRSSDAVPADWFRSLARPSAVMAANDRYAWHAIDGCRENGIAVPEDIAVVGVDNDTLLTEMVRPTLSSIDPAAERVGFEAARVLDGLMAGGPPPARAVLVPPTGVITRHSTDILSIDDEAVADAARFIRQHAAEPIGVKDVLAAVALSRRTLERRFRAVLHRSLLDEIHRVHLDRATRLLRETNLAIPAVAEQSGFAGHVRFTTVFRQRLGTTPTEYRRRFRAGVGGPTAVAASPVIGSG